MLRGEKNPYFWPRARCRVVLRNAMPAGYQMSKEEALTISFDLGIAALVGEGLYNFGELLEHPVVTTLEETEFAWLAELLRAFNAGDIAQYESLVGQHHAKLHQVW